MRVTLMSILFGIGAGKWQSNRKTVLNTAFGLETGLETANFEKNSEAIFLRITRAFQRAIQI